MTAMISERDAARAEVDSLQAQLVDVPRRSVLRLGDDNSLDVTGIVATLDRNNAQLDSRMTEIAQLRDALAAATEKSLNVGRASLCAIHIHPERGAMETASSEELKAITTTLNAVKQGSGVLNRDVKKSMAIARTQAANTSDVVGKDSSTVSAGSGL
ncbi:unnamed protein product [Sphagnum balticum]